MLDNKDKPTLIARMNAWTKKSYPRIAGMTDSELEQHFDMLQLTIKNLETFVVQSLKNDSRMAFNLMRDRGIKKVTEAPADIKVKSKNSTKSKSSGERKISGPRLNKEERIRENGISALISVGMSRADAEAHFSANKK